MGRQIPPVCVITYSRVFPLPRRHTQAVAIVVAPKDPKKQVGVFRLTEPHGLQLIQR